MKLNKGLYQDSRWQDQPYGTYSWALNWIANIDGEVLQTESGFDLKFILSSDLLPIGILSTENKVIVFSTNGLSDEFNNSEIGIYDEETESYTPILNNTIAISLGGTSSGLNFSLLHQIKGVYRYNSNNELEVAFTDWYNVPRIMYLGDFSIMQKYYSNYDISKLNVFKKYDIANASWEVSGNGSLPTNTYFAFYRYKTSDLSPTSWIIINKPIFISEFQLDATYNTIQGSTINNNSGKSILITLSNIDNTYPLLDIGLYRVSDSSAKIIIENNVNTNSIYPLSIYEGNDVEGGLSSLITPQVYYDKAKTLTSINEVLEFGNLSKTTNNILTQSFVNNFKINWKCNWIKPWESNKKPNIDLKTFQAGEVYAFFVRVKYKNKGNYSEWFHIPGRESTNINLIINNETEQNKVILNVNSKTSINSLYSSNPNEFQNENIIDPNAKLFHLRDTCTVDIEGNTLDTNEGKLGYWENENEQYTNYFDNEDLIIKDGGGFVIGDLTGNVRHHRFPSFYFLNMCINKYTHSYNLYPSGVNIEDVDFSSAFCNYTPQLGITFDIDQLANSIKDNIELLEIGYTKRDFNNCTIISTDIALFGSYETKSKQTDTALYGIEPAFFCGGNANPNAIDTNVPTSSLAGEGFNGFYDKGGANVWDETISPRQRILTPDLVDPINFNNPSLNANYISHEVFMCHRAIQKGLDCNDRNIYNSSTSNKNFGEGSGFGITSGLSEYNNHNWMLIDYTLDTKDNNNNSNYTNNDSIQFIENNNIRLQSFSDRSYPSRFINRKITTAAYVAKGTGLLDTNKLFLNGNRVVNGFIDASNNSYGYNNHLHLVLDNTNYPNSTNLLKNLFYYNKKSFKPFRQLGDVTSPSTGVDGYFFSIPSIIHDGVSTVQLNQEHNTFLSTLRQNLKIIYRGLNTKDILKADEYQDFNNNIISFYGDCFISDVNYITRGCTQSLTVNGGSVGDFVPTNSFCFRYFAPTRKQINLRKEDIETDDLTLKRFYPRSKVDFGTNSIFYNNAMVGKAVPIKESQELILDTVFNEQNEIYTYINIHSKLNQNVNNFPFRIQQSEKQQKESLLNNWKTFLALNYYEIDKTRGEITNLEGYDDVLLIHTKKTLLATRDIGRLQNDVSSLSVTIGSGQIFDFPPKDVDYDFLGYAGTQHQFGCKLTKFGYIFQDAQQGKCFLYKRDVGLQEISSDGLFNYWKNYGKSIMNDYSNNNSSGLSTFAVACDIMNNRLIISYYDKPELINESTTTRPYTLSYFKGTDNRSKWISFHSYIPDLIDNTRSKLYSFKGNRFYLHNSKENINKFYNDEIKESTIDIINNYMPISRTNDGKEALKLFQSFEWKTEVLDCITNVVKELNTFTKAQVFNNVQLSEESLLILFNNIRQYNGTWHYNEFRDNLIRTGILNKDFIKFIDNPNSGYELDQSQISINFNRRIIDTFAILRLGFSSLNEVNEPKNKLVLFEVDSRKTKTTKG